MRTQFQSDCHTPAGMFVKFGKYIVCYMLYLILGGDNAENNFSKSQIQDGGPIGGHFGTPKFIFGLVTTFH